MNVICFGAPSTYGYDPRGYFGGRYDADSRWADILAAETGWMIRNLRQNGRETARFEADLSLFCCCAPPAPAVQWES